jgi:exodeoxyribonuclease-3
VTLRLLSYNICRGGRGRETALVAVIRACDPDVVVLQEATSPAVVEELAKDSGLTIWGAAPRFSLGFLSRVPIAHHEWHRPRVSRHAFLELVPDGLAMRIFGVHLSAVHAAWTERRRVFELRALLRSISHHQIGFHVLTGDFNTLAPGELLDLRKLPKRLRPLVWLSGGTIRWRTIALVQQAGYVDAFRALHPGEPGLTFPSWSPHVRLDYLFTPTGFRERVTSCDVVTSGAGREASDHCPLLSVIDL